MMLLGSIWIQPTPLSWLLWLGVIAVFIIAVLVVLGLGMRAKNGFGVPKTWAVLASILLLVALIGYAGANYYHVYVNSSDYQRQKREYQIKYTTNTPREIKVMDYQGKVIYHYKGNFAFTRKGHGLNLTDNKTGRKISIYIGDNNTVVVTDLKK